MQYTGKNKINFIIISRMAEYVRKLKACYHAFIRIQPVQLFIHAVGETTTAGWNSGRLIPRMNTLPPADGIQEYDFLGNCPEGGDLQGSGILHATHTMELQSWMKGYRIYTDSGNSREILFRPETSKGITRQNGPGSVILMSLGNGKNEQEENTGFFFM